MPRHQDQIPEALIQMQQQLEQWRGTQPPRSKLPESIWQSAADVARQYGVYATAKALRLDYAGLKTHPRFVGPYKKGPEPVQENGCPPLRGQ